MPFCRRLHLFEVNDQAWWPVVLREKIQNALTIAWINKFPILQPISPAALVGRILSNVLGSRISDYVYVDFASGAGGPTPYIEQYLNMQLREEGKEEVKVVMTDIHPYVSAWDAASKKSDNLTYVAESVDATDAPPTSKLLKDVPGAQGKKLMRMFSLAFHHFDDDLAAEVLQNTFETSDGFCIFELQAREFSSILVVSLLWPMLMLQTPLYFLHDPVHLFFTYLLPWVPFVLVFDGYMSLLRTRTPEEVQMIIEKNIPQEEHKKWKFKSGKAQHLWPCGNVSWIICYKED